VLDFLDDHGDRPWFVHLSYLRPHPPYLAPEPYDEMYDPALVPSPVRATSRAAEATQHPLLGVMIEHPLIASPDDEDEQRELQATYYGMVSEVDAQLGRIFDWLAEAGRADNTVIVMTSDHGELLGDHWLVQKIGWFDTAFHVPLIIRDPRARFDASRGSTVNVFTEHVDVTPTLCELLDIEVPLQCDGRSLTSFLDGATPFDWRTEVHHELDLRDPDSRLLEDAFGVTLEECALAVLRDDHGKYVQFSGHHAFPPLFFDLDNDPEQLENVATNQVYAPTILDYAQRMLAWRMRHNERTLTGMKLTPHAGLVEHRAPRIR
jgi:arylsulfatase A-like enzyme